jgi:hypothetical protein
MAEAEREILTERHSCRESLAQMERKYCGLVHQVRSEGWADISRLEYAAFENRTEHRQRLWELKKEREVVVTSYRES